MEPSAKRNQTPWMIAAAVIVLCCCCVALAIGGYAFRINRIRSIPQPPSQDRVPFPTDDSPSPDLESFDIGEAPEGGLGNETLRKETWNVVAASAQGRGCDQPLGADTTIEVLQEPQDGIWVEKWTVACANGESYTYEIQYTLDATGATFDIKSLE